MKRGLARYVVFDVETTGLSAAMGHRIIEIGAVAVSGETMGEEFQSLICTDAPITKAARKVHGIGPETLVGQPEAEEVMPLFRKFIDTSTLVAHNALFDVSFLQWDFARVGLFLNSRHKCTLKMSRKRFPTLPNYKLETVARHCGILIDGGQRHRALDDARLTARIWIEMRRG